MTEQRNGAPERGETLLASIIILAGENAGRSYRVEEQILIGRSPDAHICITGTDVSRHHARIHREAGRYFVADLGSRNGMRVNGIPVTRAELHFGDRLTVGTSAILLFTHRDRLEEQFLQSQKMESLGRLAGGIAHDFNNLLATVLTNLEFLTSMTPDTPLGESEVASALSDSGRALRRAVELTRQLLGFARQGKYQDRPTDLKQIAEEVLRLTRRSVSPAIEFDLEADDDQIVIGDPNQLHQVLMNLVINGCDAMPNGGTLTIRIRSGDDDPSRSPSHLLAHRPHVVVDVEDSGVGMDEHTRARAFEPFFTTKPIGRGTGLGLSMVYGIVKNHGGDVQVESEIGRRTVIRMFLPAGVPLEESRRTDTSAEEGTGATVLVVDDDDLFRTGTARLLRHMGYRVLEASSGTEALDMFQRWHHVISVVLLDLLMPGLAGDETFDALRMIVPEARILMMTGNQDALEDDITTRGAKGFLQKPFDAASLQRTLAAALG